MRKPNTSAATDEARLSREQSQRNFEAQMKVLNDQTAAMKATKPPAYDAPPPAPTRSTANVAGAGREFRRNASRRFGTQASVSQPRLLGAPAPAL